MDKITQLENRIVKLEKMLSKSPQFQELIRDIVFFDQDSSAAAGATATVVTGINFTAKTYTTTTVSNLSTISNFVRIYFRGQVYNVPVCKIS